MSAFASSAESSADLPADCVARVRAGDVAAFEALYRAMHAPLHGFASRYLGDQARAEELVQELFLDLWIERASWTVHSSVRAYLFSAARNRALNVRRRDAVERDWSTDEGLDDVRILHRPPSRADAEMERAELLERLDRALASLPERCALVMRLRWREQMSYAEIADILGISVKGVENQLGRGLRALRERIGMK